MNLSDSLTLIGINQTISDFIDLSRIYILPSHNLWLGRDDVLSDVSSSISQNKSSISNCSDSISSMTSSESNDSVVSLQTVEDNKGGSDLMYTDFQESYLSVSSDDVIHFDSYIHSMSELTRELSIIYKNLGVQSSLNIESILKCSLDVFGKLHRNVCLLTSLDYLSRKSENNKDIVEKILANFKESYGELVLFNTQLCKLLSAEISPKIISMVLELTPYVMDTMFCILLSLLYHLESNDTKDELISIFEKMLNYCIILCYSYLDHAEELLNKMSLSALYRLTVTFIPMDLIYSIKTEAADAKKTVEYDYRVGLAEFLEKEYLKEDFKPSSVVIYKLRSKAYVNGGDEHEIKLMSRSISVFESCLKTGVSRRQYPTTHIDNVGCFEMLSSASMPNLLSSFTFWLLQRLENLNTSIRKFSLLIIRHALCTINFVERERQYILSYVYNCLSDEDTFVESLSVIECVSKLYPLKDGAVKKISNLTMKGSKAHVKLKVIDHLSKCRFTNKGLFFMLSVLKGVAKVSTNSMTHMSQNSEGTDSTDMYKLNEFMFATNEWPVIVDALVSLAKNNSDIIDKNESVSDDFAPYIKKRKLTPIPTGSWISLLWYCLTDPEDKAVLFKGLWFTEAMIRFPRLVKWLLDSERKLIGSQASDYNEFVSFETGASLQLGFMKDQNFWKALHDLRIPYPLDQLEKVTGGFSDSYTVSDGDKREPETRNGDSHNQACSCVDCKMDLAIKDYNKGFASGSHANAFAVPETSFNALNSQFDTLNGILDSGDCSRFHAPKDETTNFELLSDLKKNAEPRSFNSPIDAYSVLAYPKEFENTFYNIDDLNCFYYPASLGTDISLNFSFKSVKCPSRLFVCYMPPSIVNSVADSKPTHSPASYSDQIPPTSHFGCFSSCNIGLSHNSFNFVKTDFALDDKNNFLYHATLRFRLNFQNPIVVPVKVDFFYLIDDYSGPLCKIWVHPTCKL